MSSLRFLFLTLLIILFLALAWRGLNSSEPLLDPTPRMLPPPLELARSGLPALPAPAAAPIGAYLYPADVLSPALDQVATAGARWTRLWLSWDWIEPERTAPPTYSWEMTDRYISAAAQAGVEPIFLLGGNARWASDTFCGPLHPTAQVDFQRFLTDLVSRYSVAPYNVRLWEIYNEPDSVFGSQGFCFGTRGALYADTLRLAYGAIKAADPQATVLFGGISYDFFTTEGGRFDPAFLDEALAAGAGPYFDVLAFHYYPAFEARWNAFGPGVLGKAVYLRSELARYGLEKPLALTEIGRPTRGPAADGMVYDEQSTAQFVGPALVLARAADIAPIIWFTAVDKPAEPYDYGLLDAAFQPELSFAAYRSVLPALQGSVYEGAAPVIGDGQAHRFNQDGRAVIIAWAGAAGAALDVPAAGLWQVDRLGQATAVWDGQALDRDHTANGRLRIHLSADPVVLWLP